MFVSGSEIKGALNFESVHLYIFHLAKYLQQVILNIFNLIFSISISME